MRMAVDWNDLTFKGKDLVLTLVFVGGFVFNYATNNEKLNTIIENQSENKALFKDLVIRQTANETEIKLLRQRVDAWEKFQASSIPSR